MIAKVLLGIWLVGGVLLGGALLIRHLVAMPTPAATDSTLRGALDAITTPSRWREVHFLYRACTCSRRTIAHLLHDREPRDVDQLVVMVDDAGLPGPDDDRLRLAGFRVELVTPEILHDRFHVEAAPLLVVLTPDDELAYVGGYNRHKQSPAYEDLQIVEDLRAQRAVAALPVFGCATSARLARTFDPLGLDKLP
jgi:hypothetical protein